MHDFILAMESHYSGYCDVGISIFQLRTADIYELFRGTMQSGMILKQKDKKDASSQRTASKAVFHLIL